ncbi:MAG: hypothetical protein ACLQNG_11525 [Acidimicrobiales bacterium]
MARRESARCRDCGFNTCPRWRRRGRTEWYIVHDSVWEAAGMPSELLVFPAGPVVVRPGILCIGCLERRLGRCLTPDDFDDWPVNEPNPNQTARLADRMGPR